jgi:hypothetical protein
MREAAHLLSFHSRFFAPLRVLELSGMFTQIKLTACCLMIGLCGVVGCADGNISNTAGPPKLVLKPDVAQTPEAAIKALVDGLKASKPIVIWDAMTTNQQDAFNHMIRQFADNVDPEVWASTLDNVKKFVQLAETKKNLILKMPLLKSQKQIKPEDLKAGWDPVLKLVKTILKSELVDLEKLKRFDGREFFDGTGATLLAQAREVSHALKQDPLKVIDQLSATVTKTSDESAMAVLSLGPGKETLDVPLKVEDGKWTSERIVFVQYLISSRLDPLGARFLPYRLVDWKGEYLADMKRIGKILDQLQTANTPEDFQAVVTLQVLPFVLQKTVQFTKKTKPLTTLEAKSLARPKATALIVIKGDHFADEPGMQELIKLARETAAEGKGMSAGPFKVDEVMIFFVSPVMDTEAFAKKIHNGTVKKVDVRKNTISLELPTTASSDKTTADAQGAASKPAP